MTASVESERILILDFGAQYAQLIARRVREQNVFCQIVRHNLTVERIAELRPRGLILTGGPASVYETGAPKCDPAIFKLKIPVLGICYGMQLACQALGGQVKPAKQREFGRAECHVLHPGGLFDGVPERITVWMSHGDQVQEVGAEFIPLAATETCPVTAVRHRELPVYGLQFHPEVSHTPQGSRILRNFLYEVCGCQGLWKMQSFLEKSVAEIRERVGTRRVICGLSGGVDSSVPAAMLLRVIGPQPPRLFVDNGLLRQGERELVRDTFKGHFNADLHVVDARDRFLKEIGRAHV